MSKLESTTGVYRGIRGGISGGGHGVMYGLADSIHILVLQSIPEDDQIEQLALRLAENNPSWVVDLATLNEATNNREMPDRRINTCDQVFIGGNLCYSLLQRRCSEISNYSI